MKKKRIFTMILLLAMVSCASSQKKIEQAREKDPQYQYNVGLFYLNSNNVGEAIKYLNKSLALNPRHHLALNALGLAYSMQGKLEEAARMYLKCLEIAPTFTEARNNLGTVYQELGYIDKAEEEFKKVIDDPTYLPKELPYYNLARLYFVRSDWDRALFCADNAIKTSGRFHMAYNLKGQVLENQNRLPEAIESYKQAVKIVPEDVNYNFNLGSVYFKNKEFSKAAEVLEKIAPRVTNPDMRATLESYLKIIREGG